MINTSPTPAARINSPWRRYAIAAIAVLMATVMVQGAVAAETTLRTFTLENRAADDIAGQIHDLYPDDKLHITAHNQTLVVRARPRILNEIATLIKTIDVAPAQLRITVRSGNQVSGQSQGGGINVNGGDISVGAKNKTITTARHREHSLVVQDGQSAHIKSGQIRALPVAIQGGENPAVILQQVDISSGFLIQPRVISDDWVELRVIAMDNVPQDGLPDGYKAEAVMTTRRVEPGTWVDLGGAQTKQSGNQSGITYQVQSKRNASQRFEIKVDIM